MSLTPDAPTPPPAPTPPLFLFGDGHYPDIYASAEALCGRIEGIDLLEGDYRAYDSLGRHVQLEAVGVRRSGRWVDVGETVVAGVEDSPAHREEFRRLLTEFLSRETEGSTLAQMSLAELVEAAARGHPPIQIRTCGQIFRAAVLGYLAIGFAFALAINVLPPVDPGDPIAFEASRSIGDNIIGIVFWFIVPALTWPVAILPWLFSR